MHWVVSEMKCMDRYYLPTVHSFYHFMYLVQRIQKKKNIVLYL